MVDWKNTAQLFHCDNVDITDHTVTLFSKGGQDEFNLPDVHVVHDLPRLLTFVEGDFTFTAQCKHDGKTKFDASGLYAEYDGMRYKFGVEYYTNEVSRISSVRTEHYSDEAVGESLACCDARLMLTRAAGILSCYQVKEESLLFQRAFFIDPSITQLMIGFFVQSPFSKSGVTGVFHHIGLSSSPTDHVR